MMILITWVMTPLVPRPSFWPLLSLRKNSAHLQEENSWIRGNEEETGQGGGEFGPLKVFLGLIMA